LSIHAQKLKVIETAYRGHLFRSRLEARWAVFFDSLNVPWEYEREGYDLGGKWYLPDFWMPEQDCFIEIKGKDPSLEEEIVASVLAQKSGKVVHIFYGPIPDVGWYAGWNIENSRKFGHYAFTPDIKRISGLLWRDNSGGQYDIGEFCLSHNSATDALVKAYHKARTAQFR